MPRELYKNTQKKMLKQDKADATITDSPARAESLSICWAIVNEDIAGGAANAISIEVNSIPLNPIRIAAAEPIRGTAISLPNVQISTSLMSCFTLSNLKNAPSKTMERGEATPAMEDIVESMTCGKLRPEKLTTNPNRVARIRGLVMMDLRIFAIFGFSPLKTSRVITARKLNSGTIIAVSRAGTAEGSLL